MNKEEYENMYHLEDTHWWYVGMRSIVLQLLRGHGLLVPDRPLSILDAGCGTGGTLDSLDGYGAAVGFDACADALDFCQSRNLKSVVQASVTEVPFAAGSFDLVLSFDVLYHRNVVDDVAALREFRRVLRAGGHLLLRLPAYDWLRGSHDEVVHTRQRYNAGEVRRKLRAAGLRVERVTYANSLLFPAVALKRLIEMASGSHSGSDVGEVSPLINRALIGVLRGEARLLGGVNLPWGLSVLALAEAP